MQNDESPERSNVRYVKRRGARRFVSRTRLVMVLLLIIAIPVFIGLANRAVHENSEFIRQGFGR